MKKIEKKVNSKELKEMGISILNYLHKSLRVINKNHYKILYNNII